MKPLFILAIVFIPIGCFGQDSLAYLDKRFTIHPTHQSILIDGILTPAEWDDVAKFNYIQFRPNWGAPDSLTQLFVTFDDRYLYVGAKCYFPENEEIVARNLQRDGWMGDDWFTFHIDSYGDKQNAFVFSIYPLSSRYDMAVSNDGIELGNSTFNDAYDLVWDGKTTITAEGWFLEMKIPLSNLRFQPTEDGKIISAISSARTILARNELYVFPALPQEVQSAIMRPSIKQPVKFEGLTPKKQLLITPYLLGGWENRSVLNQQEDAYQRDGTTTGEVGLDVRYALTPKLTLDLTYNTDFSQVEVDDQVVNLDRASIFFPERRRFFQEQAGLYEVKLGSNNSQLFYSRNIGITDGQLTPITGGGRLNGKLGDWDVGGLYMRTRVTELEDESVPGENFSVARLRRKVFNDRSFVGIMGTSRFRDGYSNHTMGVDGLVNLEKDLYLVSSLAYSHDTGQPTHDLLNNTLFYGELSNRVEAGWIYELRYNYAAPDFNPGLGFVARENVHNPYFLIGRGKFKERGEGRFQYENWTFLSSDHYWGADDGAFESWVNYSSWTGTNFLGDNFEVTHVRELQALQDTLFISDALYALPGTYFHQRGFLRFTQARQKRFRHSISTHFGNFYDGGRFTLTYAPRFNINKHLNITGRWRADYLDFRKAGSTKGWVHVARVTLETAADLHLSGSFTFQYNSVSRTLFNNARIRYNFRDGHDLFLVYNETYNTEREREDPILPLSAQQTIVLKYLYTFYK